MNIWAMNIDLGIKQVLIELMHRHGESHFSLREMPEQFEAVEIYLNECPQLGAYLYTFAQNPGKYAIDLKYPIPEHNLIGANENLSLEQLFSIFNSHFDL